MTVISAVSAGRVFPENNEKIAETIGEGNRRASDKTSERTLDRSYKPHEDTSEPNLSGGTFR